MSIVVTVSYYRALLLRGYMWDKRLHTCTFIFDEDQILLFDLLQFVSRGVCHWPEPFTHLYSSTPIYVCMLYVSIYLSYVLYVSMYLTDVSTFRQDKI